MREVKCYRVYNSSLGENDNEICKLIQKDLIEEFIIYVNKNFYPIKSTINSSIYETNNFLIKRVNDDDDDYFFRYQKNITLIEYAVFFGSIQIFNYLRQNGAELNPSLWIFAVHGQNEEIIHFLEDNNILPSTFFYCFDSSVVSFELIFKESIKCHHIYAI